jgi:hypothetical protein
MKHTRNSALAFGLTVVLLLCLAQSQVFAQDSGSTQFTITGTAPNICALPAPAATGTANNATFASNTVTLTQFLNPNTALVNPSSLAVQFPNTLCNYNATVSLSSKSGGMVASNTSTIAGGSGTFLQNVPYTVTANWGSFSLLLDTSTSNGSTLSVSKQTGGANAGNLTLTFATQVSALPVAQGSYQDTVTVKIGASL